VRREKRSFFGFAERPNKMRISREISVPENSSGKSKHRNLVGSMVSGTDAAGGQVTSSPDLNADERIRPSAAYTDRETGDEEFPTDRSAATMIEDHFITSNCVLASTNRGD
jgi:hypothetical protein